jgi:uncharacterized peroxidase-related enzyme
VSDPAEEIIQQFTTTVPRWSPHIRPIRLEDATPLQRKSLEVTPSNGPISDYVLVLAHDPETLIHRNPLFNEIMAGSEGGLSRSERELGAVGASEVNRCIYCTAVHSKRYVELTDQADVIDNIFKDESAAVLPPREQALFNYAVALAAVPPAPNAAHIEALRDAGLSDLEIVDLTLSATIFCWANRLMETLGQPVARAD